MSHSDARWRYRAILFEESKTSAGVVQHRAGSWRTFEAEKMSVTRWIAVELRRVLLHSSQQVPNNVKMQIVCYKCIAKVSEINVRFFYMVLVFSILL